MKKIVSVFLALILTLGPIAMVMSQEAYAAEAAQGGSGFDVFLDSNKNICIITNDQIRASNTYYRTVGFTVSRGMKDQRKLMSGAATEYIQVFMDEMTVSPINIGTRQINAFEFPFDSFKAKVQSKGYNEWYQDIIDAESFGGSLYVRFDSIMKIYNGKNAEPHFYRNDPTVGPYDDEQRDLNPREIQNAKGWRAGSRTGLRTHFHRWLVLGRQLPVQTAAAAQPLKFKDHHVTIQSGENGTPSGLLSLGGNSTTVYGDYSGMPAYAGADGNLEGYNASEGVPSTSSITGIAEASPWVGCIDVWARMVTKEIRTTFRYFWIPQEKTSYTGEDSVTNAISTLNEKEDKDKEDDTRHCIKDKDAHMQVEHDTDLEDVYNHWLKTEWADGDGHKLPSGGSRIKGSNPSVYGNENPTVPSSEYNDPKAPTAPQWQDGWTYEERHISSIDGSETWHSASDTDPCYSNFPEKPSGSDVRNVKEHWVDATPYKTEFKLTCICDRVFFDDDIGDGTPDPEKKVMQIYAAFEYINPFRTMFWDLDSVHLFNDIYDTGADDETGKHSKDGSIGFSQTVPTGDPYGAAEAKKSKKDGESLGLTEDFEEFVRSLEDDKGNVLLTDTANIAAKIATNDYLVWPKSEDTKDGIHKKGKISLTYKEDVTKLQKLIYEETITQNDYVCVKNPIDLGPADGIYIGGDEKNKWTPQKGIVKGCDFRDAWWMLGAGALKPGSESLGAVSEELRTTKKLNVGDMTGSETIDISKYWFKCKNSSAQDEGVAHAYTEDGMGKVAGKNQVFEKLGNVTVPIVRTTSDGAHGTDILAMYAPISGIVGPMSMTTTPVVDVLNGHLYSDEIGSSGTPLNFSYWGGIYVSEEGPHNPDGSRAAGPGLISDNVNEHSHW